MGANLDTPEVRDASAGYDLQNTPPILPIGYKQTEVGVIPDDWKAVPLSHTATRITRGASPRPIDSPLWFDSKSSVGWVRISDVTRSGRFLLETTQKLSQEGIRHSRPVSAGSLIMSICATVGRPIETKIDVCIHDGFVVFDQPKVDQSFLYHVLSSLEPTWAKSGQTGSQMNLNTGIINSRLVPLPPSEEEQRAIADALSDVDALLEELDRLIAKKRDIKQATMQQLLTGKTRLPGFAGDWEKKPIGPLIDLLTGFPFPSQKYTSSGIRLLRGSNIKRGVTDWSDDLVHYWSTVTPNLQQYFLREGDIVIAMDGSLVGRSFARVSPADLPALLLQRVARVRSTQIDMDYLNEWVCSSFFTEHCDAHKTVTAIPHISPGDIRSFTIFVPPSLKEQAAVASVLSDMGDEIEALRHRRNKTADLKQAMMQELLTGRTRLV